MNEILVLIIAVVVVFLVMCVISGFVDGNRFRVVKETVELPKIERDFRFVMISDLHNKVYGYNNDKVIKAVKNINPDFVIIAGDLITSKVSEPMTPGIELINAIAEEYKVYYALGNHESKIKQRESVFGDKFMQLKEAVKNENIVMLENKSIVIPEYNINLTGLELDLDYFAHFKKRPMEKDYLQDNIGTPKSSCCNILIAHNPDYFEEYSEWGADLVLSGHVHGGIMRLPVLGGVIAPSYILFPKYDGGIFKRGKATMLLGRGMGAHTIPLRIFNPAELYEVCVKEGRK